VALRWPSFAGEGRARRAIRWLGRHDLSLVVTLALAGAGIWIFVEVADAILEREAHAIDRAILLAMRHPADPSVPAGPGWLKEVARDVTALGGVTVLSFTSIAVVGYLLLRRAFSTALLTAVAVLGVISDN
jgi:undecaprenyl-diphosphatase